MRVEWGKHESKGLLCKLGSKYDDMTTYAEIGLFLRHEMLEQPKLGRDNIRCF